MIWFKSNYRIELFTRSEIRSVKCSNSTQQPNSNSVDLGVRPISVSEEEKLSVEFEKKGVETTIFVIRLRAFRLSPFLVSNVDLMSCFWIDLYLYCWLLLIIYYSS